MDRRGDFERGLQIMLQEIGAPLRRRGNLIAMCYNIFCCGGVAQLGEHLVRNEGVVGSNPIVSTNKNVSRETGFFVCNKGIRTREGANVKQNDLVGHFVVSVGARYRSRARVGDVPRMRSRRESHRLHHKNVSQQTGFFIYNKGIRTREGANVCLKTGA